MKVRSFVINLDRRPERMEAFRSRTEKFEKTIVFERVSGVDGQMLTEKSEHVGLFSKNLSRSEVGIAIRHYLLWSQLLADPDHDAYLVTEDDLDFFDDYKFPERLEKIKTELKKKPNYESWLMVWLSSINPEYHASKSKRPLAPDVDKISLVKTGWSYYGGMWCYLISKHGAQKLVDWIRAGQCNRSIDSWISHLGPEKFPTLSVVPMIAWANIAEHGAPSDIQHDKSKIIPVGRLGFLDLGNESRFGRLGNQLFEVGAALTLSKKLGWDKPLLPNKWRHLIAFKNTDWFQPYDPKIHGPKKNTLKEPHDFAHIENPLLQLTGDLGLVEMEGYFQNPNYLIPYRSQLEQWFAPSKQILANISKRSSDFFSWCNVDLREFCAVHVRRGDYLNLNVCLPDEYYWRAMDMVKRKQPTLRFLIFTDDIEYCNRIFGKSCFVMDSKPVTHDYEDIIFMAMCGAQIIANSSFSWWAAFLRHASFSKPNVNQNIFKMVVAPKPWFAHMPLSANLYCPDWTILDRFQHQEEPHPSKRGPNDLPASGKRGPKDVRVGFVDGGQYFRDFFTSVCSEMKEIVQENNKKIDMVVSSVFGERHKQNHQTNTVEIFVCGEPRSDDQISSVIADLRLHCCRTSSSIYLPFWLTSFFERKGKVTALNDFREMSVKPRKQIKPKTKFCAFMYSNEVPERNAFFDALSKYKRVDGLGKCRRNTDSPIDRHDSYFYDAAVERYEDYKFVIAFESKHLEGYITEKLINPMLCKNPCVIIAYTAPDVARYFNPKSFINLANFPTHEAAVQFIAQVDQSPQLYQQFLDQPYVLFKQQPHADITYYAPIIRRVIVKEMTETVDLKETVNKSSSVVSTKNIKEYEVKNDVRLKLEKGVFGEWTVVTGLFDIPTDTGVKASTNRSIDFYLRYRFVMELNFPLVVFCDPVTYPKLWSIRAQMKLLHKTCFIPMHLRDFPLWKYHDKIAENRKKPPVYDPKHRNTPAYFILTTGKFHMLRKSIQLNPFGTQYVAWCDFGLQHIGDGRQAKQSLMEAAFQQKRIKPSFGFISYLPPSIAKDPFQMYSFADGRCTIASSFFTARNDWMLKLCDEIENEFIKVVSLGRGHAEEQLLCTVWARNPEMFEFFYSDYAEQLLNYVSISANAEAVLSFFIDRAMADQNFSAAQDACVKLIDAAIHKHTVQLNPDQLIRLLEHTTTVAQRLQLFDLLAIVQQIWKTQSAQPNVLVTAQRRMSTLLPKPTKATMVQPSPPPPSPPKPTDDPKPSPVADDVRGMPSKTKNTIVAISSAAKSTVSAKAVVRVLRKREYNNVDKKVVDDRCEEYRVLLDPCPVVMSEEEMTEMSAKAFGWISGLVCINLDKRPKRLRESLDEHLRVRFPIEKFFRFSAIIAEPVWVGCNLSHIGALETAKRLKWSNVIVTEDDFNWIANHKLLWQQLYGFGLKYGHKGGFKVAMLTAGGLKHTLPCDEFVKYGRQSPNAAGYIVNESFYDELIQCWKTATQKLKQTHRHDLYISDAAWQPLQTGNWFVFNPLLGYQRPSFSDLANAFTNHHGIPN